jgi:hypothetical protein
MVKTCRKEIVGKIGFENLKKQVKEINLDEEKKFLLT